MAQHGMQAIVQETILKPVITVTAIPVVNHLVVQGTPGLMVDGSVTHFQVFQSSPVTAGNNFYQAHTI